MYLSPGRCIESTPQRYSAPFVFVADYTNFLFQEGDRELFIETTLEQDFRSHDDIYTAEKATNWYFYPGEDPKNSFMSWLPSLMSREPFIDLREFGRDELILLLDLMTYGKACDVFVLDKLSEGSGVRIVFSPMEVDVRPSVVQSDLVLVYRYLWLNEFGSLWPAVPSIWPKLQSSCVVKPHRLMVLACDWR
jgi:hypothetical protein